MTVIETPIDLTPVEVSVPRSLRRKLGSWLLLAVLVAAWAVTLRPVALGGPAGFILVEGRSMEPRYHTGDLVVTQRAETYGKGDIIGFVVPENEPGAGGRVIHRIVGGGSAGYQTQGDNASHPDAMWHPTSDDVIGKAWFVIPKAGVALTWLRTPLNIAMVLALLAFLTYFVPEEKVAVRRRKPPVPKTPPVPEERSRSGRWPQPYWP